MDNKAKYKKANSDPEKNEKDPNARKSAWNNLGKKMSILLPYLWPKSNYLIQTRVIVCVLLVLGLRVVNVFVPRVNRDIVDILALDMGQFPVDKILLYSFLKIMQGGVGAACKFGGIINCFKGVLWIRVNQNCVKNLKLDFFNHLHRLGVRWHYARKTGEVLRVMDRGTSSVTTILDTAFFSLIPLIIDIIIAAGALSYDLNIYFGLIIVITMIVYVIVTIIGTEFRTKYKRKMNNADNEQRSKSVDSLLNSETVKLYGNEDYESGQFSYYMDKYLHKEWLNEMTVIGVNLFQTFTLNAGLLAGSLYCAYLISQHRLTVGDFVLFGTYMIQLMQPLNNLSTLYTTIQEAMINMENMFELLDEEEEIKDLPEAAEFSAKTTAITFDNVSFHYDYKMPVLKNISLNIPEGSTIAIVGPTGSGKSTLIKLLLRLFDPIEGNIVIGDQNVKHVQQTTLRQKIGVVPQETVLFNETIEFNIKYGKIDAEESDTVSAAKIAEIHDKIDSFPEKYQTKVGERGLKLSGGEKQRVAIARALLRSPQLMLLDEATSSLDSATERNIQTALDEVCRNRTCVIVAHRLSTIINADQIIVLKDGVIVEQGTHDHLLNLSGVYADMWSKQTSKQL